MPIGESNLDKLRAMRVFVRVVESQSFVRAAESLGILPATVTQLIQALEGELRLRLINRSTRKFSLTSDGEFYYQACVRVIEEIEDVEESLHTSAQKPVGRLRVDVSPAIAYRVIVPNLSDFCEKYPDIELFIGLGDRPVDLVQDAVNCAVRVGDLADSSLIARRLALVHFSICASPAYLLRYGTPQSLSDLSSHHVIRYFSTRSGRVLDWKWKGDIGDEVKFKHSVFVNDAEACLKGGVAGLGLIMSPKFMVADFIRSGELKEISLDGVELPELPVSIVYPAGINSLPKVRCFSDWLFSVFSEVDGF